VKDQIKREGNTVNTSKAKPDLMAASSTESGGGKRILAQLEHGPKPAAKTAQGWTIDGWTVGLILLLLLMCTTAWLMHDDAIRPATFKPGSPHEQKARSEPAAQHSAARAGEAAALRTAQPAAIVNEPTPALIIAAPALLPVSQTPNTSRPEISPAQAATPRVAATARKPAITTAAVGRTAAAQPATSAANSAQRNASAASSDTDVTLLTALVAHANKPTVVAPERSRDVVERQDGDSTAQLLARCKQLGLIEGMLCRSRICSGRWESDAACRAPTP
jgi:hypothetical protein